MRNALNGSLKFCGIAANFNGDTFYSIGRHTVPPFIFLQTKRADFSALVKMAPDISLMPSSIICASGLHNYSH
jgi:hypothetical protein